MRMGVWDRVLHLVRDWVLYLVRGIPGESGLHRQETVELPMSQ